MTGGNRFRSVVLAIAECWVIDECVAIRQQKAVRAFYQTDELFTRLMMS